MAGNSVAAVRRLGVLLRSALSHFESGIFIYGICAVSAARDLAAVNTVT